MAWLVPLFDDATKTKRERNPVMSKPRCSPLAARNRFRFNNFSFFFLYRD